MQAVASDHVGDVDGQLDAGHESPPHESACDSGRLQQPGKARRICCVYLAIAVFAGLLANTVFGAWWIDGAVALVIAGWATVEGATGMGRTIMRMRRPDRDALLNSEMPAPRS
jgi:hypothetical protein